MRLPAPVNSLKNLQFFLIGQKLYFLICFQAVQIFEEMFMIFRNRSALFVVSGDYRQPAQPNAQTPNERKASEKGRHYTAVQHCSALATVPLT